MYFIHWGLLYKLPLNGIVKLYIKRNKNLLFNLRLYISYIRIYCTIVYGSYLWVNILSMLTLEKYIFILTGFVGGLYIYIYI